MNNNERNSFIAIAICVVFYLGYTQYLSRKYPDHGKAPNAVTENSQPTDSAASTGTPGSASTAAQTSANLPSGQTTTQVNTLSADQLVIDAGQTVYKFDQSLGAISSIKLKNYRKDVSKDSEPVELLDSPLLLRAGLKAEANLESLTGFSAERRGQSLVFWREIPGWRFEQTFTPSDKDFRAQVSVAIQNTGAVPSDLDGGLFFGEKLLLQHKSSGFSIIPGSIVERSRLVSFTGTSSLHIDAKSFCSSDTEKGPRANSDKIEFVGFDHHYFVTVLSPQAQKSDLQSIRLREPQGEYCDVAYRLMGPQGVIQPGQTVNIAFDAYFGPKIVENMAAFNSKLESTLDLGWFDWLAHPLLHAIKGFHKVTGNYGVAINILTLLLKILFYPLTKAAAVSMHKMKKLNPEMAKIREKFKADPRQQQQELMRFMAQHKINPAKGCIPILPQIPVFFALFRMLSASFELRHAPFYGWIKDLSAMDPYLVTPVLLGVGMFVQQKLTPTTGMDKTQEKIMMMMPIIFAVMMITLPAGLVLYMLTNTVVSIAQQQYLNRKLDKSH